MSTRSAILKADYIRGLAVDYAYRFIGLPYIYGGDDPIEGFDCSGLIHEILQAVGVEARNYDSTAHSLWVNFMVDGKEVAVPYTGCLVFYVNENDIASHVGFMIDDKHMIHAGGGRSTTRTRADAVRQNAYVRMDRYDYRDDLFPKFADPFMVKE